MNVQIKLVSSRTIIALAAAIFALWLLASLAYDLWKIRVYTEEKALTEARSLFNLNLAYRRWNAGHGGVYVPVTSEYQPNPYLIMAPKRDLTATDGTKLTLVNPAMMTRRVHEILSRNTSLPVINKVTSLKYLNPANAPDEWEATTLRAFEHGSAEAGERTVINGQPYMRLMKPYLVEKGCLSCHEKQDYTLGDVRGGLSIGVPMKPYLELEAQERRKSVLSHAFIWMIGMTGIGLLGVLVRNAERGVAKERLFTETAINTMNGAFFVQNAQGKIIRWNESLRDLLGVADDGLPGMDGLLFIHPDDREYVRRKWTEVLSQGFAEVEARVLAKGGHETRYFYLAARRMILDGQAYSVGSGIDITERKVMEEKVRSSSAVWATTFDAIHDCIMILDREYRIVQCNKATEHLLNLPQEQIVGRRCWELMHSGSGPEGCPVAGMLKNKRRESAIIDALGRTFIITADPILDEAGAVQKIVHTISDITEQKKLESELHQAQKMEAIGALAGGVAHDFNNILSAVIGFGSILQRKLKADDPLRQYVDPILLSSERATALTRTLLSFSRKEKPVLKLVDANAVVGGFQKVLARLIGEDIELSVSIAPEPLNINADAGQLEQVLMNLVTNARDAMPRGGKLAVATQQIVYAGEHGDVHPGAYAMISVSDTGVGMDKATQEHIFEPFFTTKEVGKGTGLGLAIVYGIIKNHGGSIHVYSEKGLGTTFKVILPLVDSGVVREHEPREHQEIPAGTETLLLAEDDAGARQVAKILLEECGYTVLVAADGEEAVMLFRNNKDRIHLFLTDLIMPKMNGREAYEEMKRMRPDLKAVFMSGYTADIISSKGILDEGMTFVSKPLIPTELFKSIRAALQKG